MSIDAQATQDFVPVKEIRDGMGVLNSIDFSTQIVVQSRRLDITPYLLTLEKKYESQVEPLLKIQTKQYIEFIKDFTDQNSIMTKNFIIVVPYGSEQLAFEKSGFLGKIFGGSKSKAKIEERKAFEESRTQIEQRIGLVQNGLASCGLTSSVLNSDEV